MSTKHPLSSKFAITSRKARQLTRFRNCNQIAIVIVGEEKKEWRIPTDLLCFHSGYFRSALKGGFAEAKTKIVKLLEEETATFELVVEWLYTHGVGARLPYKDWEEHCAKIGKLLNTWVLAEHLQMPKLQNVIIRSMSDQMATMENIPYKEFNRVCEIVGSDSPLWTWMGEWAVWVLRDYDYFYEECIEASAVQLLVNVCQTLQVTPHISGNECPINESCLVDELEVYGENMVEEDGDEES